MLKAYFAFTEDPVIFDRLRRECQTRHSVVYSGLTSTQMEEHALRSFFDEDWEACMYAKIPGNIRSYIFLVPSVANATLNCRRAIRIHNCNYNLATHHHEHLTPAGATEYVNINVSICASTCLNPAPIPASEIVKQFTFKAHESYTLGDEFGDRRADPQKEDVEIINQMMTESAYETLPPDDVEIQERRQALYRLWHTRILACSKYALYLVIMASVLLNIVLTFAYRNLTFELQVQLSAQAHTISEFVRNQTSWDQLVDLGPLPAMWPRPEVSSLGTTTILTHYTTHVLVQFGQALYNLSTVHAPALIDSYFVGVEQHWRTTLIVALILFSLTFGIALLPIAWWMYQAVDFKLYRRFYSRLAVIKPATQTTAESVVTLNGNELALRVLREGEVVKEFVNIAQPVFAVKAADVPKFILKLVINDAECGHAFYAVDSKERTGVFINHHVWKFGSPLSSNKFGVVARDGSIYPLENFVDMHPTRGWREQQKDGSPGLDIIKLRFHDLAAEKRFKCQLGVGAPGDIFPGIPRSEVDVTLYASSEDRNFTTTGWFQSAGTLTKIPGKYLFYQHNCGALNGTCGAPILSKVGGTKWVIMGVHTGYERDALTKKPKHSLASSMYPFNMRAEYKTLKQAFGERVSESSDSDPSSEWLRKRVPHNSDARVQAQVNDEIGDESFNDGFDQDDDKYDAQYDSYEDKHNWAGDGGPGSRMYFDRIRESEVDFQTPEGNRQEELRPETTIDAASVARVEPATSCQKSLSTLTPPPCVTIPPPSNSSMETQTVVVIPSSGLLAIATNQVAPPEQKGKGELSEKLNPGPSNSLLQCETQSATLSTPPKAQKRKKRRSKGSQSSVQKRLPPRQKK